MRKVGTAEELRGRTSGRRRWWWAPLVAGVLAVSACGSETDDLDEGPEPPESDTEIVPGEGGPVD
jgi:hypothetical protein